MANPYYQQSDFNRTTGKMTESGIKLFAKALNGFLMMSFKFVRSMVQMALGK